MQLFLEFRARNLEQPILFFVCVFIDSKRHYGVNQLLTIGQACLVDIVKDILLLFLNHFFLFGIDVELTFIRPVAHLAQLKVSLHMGHFVSLLGDKHETANFGPCLCSLSLELAQVGVRLCQLTLMLAHLRIAPTRGTLMHRFSFCRLALFERACGALCWT